MEDKLTEKSIAKMRAELVAPPLIYLASPYMHDSEVIREKRYLEAAEDTAALIRMGGHMFSPIVHCHPMALKYDLPKDSDYWIGYNEAMLKVCDELYVLCTNGIDISTGVHREIIIADAKGMPVSFIERLNSKGDIPFISQRKARVTWGVKI